jgi:hypothetical protein
MDGFARKHQMVAEGHMTEAPKTLTRASAVSKESAQITLTMATLSYLEVKAADVQNACLTAPVSEKIWTRLGGEFGSDAGKKAAVVSWGNLKNEKRPHKLRKRTMVKHPQ